IALALEDAVLLQVNLDVQVSGGTSIDAGLAVAGRADTHAVVDACRDLDLQRLVAAYTPHPVARRAWIGDFLAGGMAGRAVLLNAEETLLHAHHTSAVAGVAGARVSPRLGTRSMTDVAAFPAGHANLGIEAVGCLLQRDVECVLQVRAPVHLG